MKYYPYLLFFIGFLVCSCQTPAFFEQNSSINNSVWNVQDKLIFDFQIEDTLAFYDLYINVRNTGKYKFSNLYIFSDTKFPDGEIYRDTIECILADLSGRWLGSGIGDVFDNRILYKPNVHFNIAGQYQITFEQAMRQPELSEIMDVGLRIEKKN
jgi:gliding motility-associated lipoprotein GldH